MKSNRSNSILPYLLLLPFCIPEIAYFSEDLSFYIKVWKVIVVLFASFIGLRNIKLLNGSVRYILGMFLFIIIVSFINRDIPYIIAYEISIIIMFSHYIRKQDFSILKAFVQIAEFLIIANFISILIYPNGMYSTVSLTENVGYDKNWLLGYKNPMVRFMLPACISSHILYIYDSNFKKWRAWGITLISILTTIMVDSSTGFGGIMLFSVCILIYNLNIFKTLRNFFTISKFLVLVLIINLFFLILQDVGYFSWIIENIFNREANLTGRTSIWTTALELMSNNILCGYGSGSEDILSEFTYAHHPHNYILYILLQGGVIALFLFILSVIYANQEVNKINCIQLKGIIIGGFSSFLIMGITESLTSGFFLFIIYSFCQLKMYRQ